MYHKLVKAYHTWQKDNTPHNAYEVCTAADAIRCNKHPDVEYFCGRWSRWLEQDRAQRIISRLMYAEVVKACEEWLKTGPALAVHKAAREVQKVFPNNPHNATLGFICNAVVSPIYAPHVINQAVETLRGRSVQFVVTKSLFAVLPDLAFGIPYSPFKEEPNTITILVRPQHAQHFRDVFTGFIAATKKGSYNEQ